uniref:Uncharacterized protein n=1 Tax=Sus scrofa TaxID=9823 RepID=A0A8D1TRF6_PIG
MFLEKCLFRSFAHFSIGLLAFLLLSCVSCLYILKVKPLSVASFEIIFSHSVSCLFVFFLVSFAVQKLVSLSRSHWFVFVFISVALGDPNYFYSCPSQNSTRECEGHRLGSLFWLMAWGEDRWLLVFSCDGGSTTWAAGVVSCFVVPLPCLQAAP